MRQSLKFIAALTIVSLGGICSPHADEPQSDYQRIMSAVSNSSDDNSSGSGGNGGQSPSQLNGNSSNTAQPISIYGQHSFRGTVGANSSGFAAGNQPSGFHSPSLGGAIGQ